MEYPARTLVPVHESWLELVRHTYSSGSACRTHHYSAIAALFAAFGRSYVARISDPGSGNGISPRISVDTKIYTHLAAGCASFRTLLPLCSRAYWLKYL